MISLITESFGITLAYFFSYQAILKTYEIKQASTFKRNTIYEIESKINQIMAQKDDKDVWWKKIWNYLKSKGLNDYGVAGADGQLRRAERFETDLCRIYTYERKQRK